jgi:hypothetical protein
MQDEFLLDETPRTQSSVWTKKSVLTLDYVPEQIRGLCGRGNLVQELAFNKNRVFRAKMGWNFASSEKVAGELAKKLNGLSGEKIAIFLDGSLTLEEVAKAIELGKKLGTKFIAPIPVEDIAVAPFKNNFTFDGIANATTNVLVGDIFTLSPTITRLVHDAKSKARQNAVVSIDTVKSRTGWFAHPELVPVLGKEIALLDAIADAISGKPIDQLPLKEIGIAQGDFEWAVGAIKGATGKGNILVAPGWHFSDPFGVAKAAKKLAEVAKLGFGIIPLSTGSRGSYRLLASAGCDMAGAIKAFYGGKLDAVICFDCDPLSALPGAKIPEIFAMTGQLSTEGYDKATHFIPTSYLFEKTGSLFSTEGGIIEIKEKINSPVTHSAGNVIELISGGSIAVSPDIYNKVRDFPESDKPAVQTGGNVQGELIAVGQPHVNHHCDGRYTRRVDFIKLRNEIEISQVTISEKLGEKLDVENDAKIKLTSAGSSAIFPVKIVDYLPANIVLVPMHYIPGRELFNFGANPTGSPIPVKAEKA